VSGGAAACLSARSLAEKNGASLTRCDVEGSIVDVTVAMAPPTWAAWLGPARLNARAGPSDI